MVKEVILEVYVKPVLVKNFIAGSMTYYLIAISEASRPETKLSERSRDAILRRGKRTYLVFTRT